MNRIVAIVVKIVVAALFVGLGYAAAVFKPKIVPVRFEIVGLRVDEIKEDTDNGPCRSFEARVSIATQNPDFDVAGRVAIMARDKAANDKIKNGDWVVHECQMIPLGIKATREFSFVHRAFTPEGIDSRYVAACGVKIQKNCREPENNGPWLEKPRERETPVLEFKILSFSLDEGRNGTIVQ